jgi:hypothetical protein
MNNDIENTTKELLKKSMLTIPDENFSDRIMEKIHQEEMQKRPFFSSISLAWIFTILSLVLVPFSLPVFVKNFHFLNILDQIKLELDPNSLSIILCICFAIVILSIIDNLFKLTFWKREVVRS